MLIITGKKNQSKITLAEEKNDLENEDEEVIENQPRKIKTKLN